MNGQKKSEKGQSHNQPKGNSKGKGKGKKNIQEKGTTTRRRLDLQLKMDSARWVILVQNVKELNLSVRSKRMMILRVSVWIEQLMCFVFKSATVFQWIRRNCRVRRRESVMDMKSQRALMKNSISQRERYLSQLDVEMIDQLSTLEVLCPRVQWIMRHRFRQKKYAQYSTHLESVLGESLQHYGIKRNVPFTNRSGRSMNVNFEVTDTKRAILSVHKGCGNGSMIVFTRDGKCITVNDKNCFEQVKQIMASTQGFDIVYDREAYVLDVDVNDGVYVNNERQQSGHNSGISFPVIRKKYWERAFESSTARSRTTAKNSTRGPW